MLTVGETDEFDWSVEVESGVSVTVWFPELSDHLGKKQKYDTNVIIVSTAISCAVRKTHGRCIVFTLAETHFGNVNTGMILTKNDDTVQIEKGIVSLEPNIHLFELIKIG